MANDPLAAENLILAVNLFSSTTVVAVLYTLIFVLYFQAFRLSYAQLRNDQGKINRQTVCTLVFQTVLLICATLDGILKNYVAKVHVIDSALPGGPNSGQVASKLVTLAKIDEVVSYLETSLLLGVLLWRVRVVLSGTRLERPLTVIFLFLYLVVAALGLSYYVIAWKIGFLTLETTPLILVVLYPTLGAFSLASSVLMSGAIIARLLIIRRKHIKVMGKSDVAGQYLGIAAVVIESYALDAVWGIGSFISYNLKYTPSYALFNTCAIQVDVLTNFLLIYRVLSGRAWTRQTQDRLSTLRWASDGAGTTTSGAVDLRRTNMAEEDASVPVICSRNDV